MNERCLVICLPLFVQASICSLHPSTDVERKQKPKPVNIQLLFDCHVLYTDCFGKSLMGINPRVQTRPGVVRPMTAIPRLMVEEEFHPKPLRPFVIKNLTVERKVGRGTALQNLHIFPWHFVWHQDAKMSLFYFSKPPQFLNTYNERPPFKSFHGRKKLKDV